MPDDQVTIDDCEFSMDGELWQCNIIGANDIMVDPFGWGITQKEAFEDLLENWYK